MRIGLFAAALAACFGYGLPPAAAQMRPMPVVTVNGEASIAVQPDTAIISAGVTTQGKTAREAGEASGRAMTSVLAALKDAGIADADIQTSRISIQPVREQVHGAPGRVTGFQSTNQVTVKVREIGNVADLIDRLVGAGANTLSGVEFVVADPSKALDQARRDGIADARHKAELYAAAVGAGLGHVVSIDEQNAPPRFLRGALAQAPGSTPIAVGEETLRLTVTATYELLY